MIENEDKLLNIAKEYNDFVFIYFVNMYLIPPSILNNYLKLYY